MDDQGWTAGRAKQDTPIWRPPGPTEGRPIVRQHRRPPPPPSELPADDKASELLAQELRKSAAILAQAQGQMAQERQLSAMRQREAEAQLAEAIELGRQEERQKTQQEVREANDTLTALAEANEQGAAFVKRVERAHIAGALAEQRRGLEHQLNESRLVTEHEIGELKHVEGERHAREVTALREQLEQAGEENAALSQRVSTLEEVLATTKEGRIMAHQQRSIRRMMRSGLAKGWTQWHTQWEAGRYLRLLVKRAQGQFFHIVPTVCAACPALAAVARPRGSGRCEEAARRRAAEPPAGTPPRRASQALHRATLQALHHLACTAQEGGAPGSTHSAARLAPLNAHPPPLATRRPPSAARHSPPARLSTAHRPPLRLSTDHRPSLAARRSASLAGARGFLQLGAAAGDAAGVAAGPRGGDGA